jgi:hypothetical protein
MEFVSPSPEVVFFPANEKFVSPILGGVRFPSQIGVFSVSPEFVSPSRGVVYFLANRKFVSPISGGCNVSPSLTDMFPTENSWMLHPLDKVSLVYFAPDRTIPSLNSDFE